MVERVDINSVLMQMRQVKDTIRAQHQASQLNASQLQASQLQNSQQNGINPAGQTSNFQQVLQQQTSQAVTGNSAITSSSQTNPVSSQFNSLLQGQGLQEDQVNLQSQKLQPLPLDNPAEQVVPDFKTMFGSAVDKVNEQQKTAAQLATRFEQGDPTVDLPEVMIALQKSSVSFQAMTQVRNKLVEAYKDIMNMPV